MYTKSISPSSHGNFYELYAIAAAVLGGFSLRGGEGSIIGVVLGAVLLQVLQNLVNLLGIPSSLNFAVMGSVILVGVLADQQFSDTAAGARRRLDPAGAGDTDQGRQRRRALTQGRRRFSTFATKSLLLVRTLTGRNAEPKTGRAKTRPGTRRRRGRMVPTVLTRRSAISRHAALADAGGR